MFQRFSHIDTHALCLCKTFSSNYTDFPALLISSYILNESNQGNLDVQYMTSCMGSPTNKYDSKLSYNSSLLVYMLCISYIYRDIMNSLQLVLTTTIILPFKKRHFLPSFFGRVFGCIRGTPACKQVSMHAHGSSIVQHTLLITPPFILCHYQFVPFVYMVAWLISAKNFWFSVCAS